MFVYVKAQLSVSEREIQEMIRQRIRKMEEIRTSVAELEVGHTQHTHTNSCEPVHSFLVHLSVLESNPDPDLNPLTLQVPCLIVVWLSPYLSS